MDFIDLELDISVLRHQTLPTPHTGKPQRQRVRVEQREKVSLPVLRQPAIAAHVIDRYYGGIHPIYHADDAFFAGVAVRTGISDPKAVLTMLFRPHHSSSSDAGVLGEGDIATLGRRFAVHAAEGALLERIHEPVWLVETRDTGGRMNVRENAKQGVSAHLSYEPNRSVQNFDGGPVPPSGAPCVMFAATREAAAQRLRPGVASDTGWGQVEHYRSDRIEVLRPDLFTIDDRAGSLRMIGPMMVALGHAVCQALSRAGIERWIDLRRRVGIDHASARDYAEIQDFAAGLLRELRGLRSENRELDVMLKRARNCAAMLVHRLDADNTYERAAEADFDGDLPGLAP